MEVCLAIGQGLVILPTEEVLSSNNEGPVDIKVQLLDTQQKLQLISQLRRGIIVPVKNEQAKADIDYLQTFLTEVQAVQQPPPQPTVEQKKQSASFQEEVAQLTTEMKKILRKKVDVIKREAKQLRPRELDMLISIETEWKKRKGLLSYLKGLRDDVRSVVPQSLQTVSRKDVKHIAMCAEAMSRRSIPPQYRGLIGEIEEVEEDEIEIKMK